VICAIFQATNVLFPSFVSPVWIVRYPSGVNDFHSQRTRLLWTSAACVITEK